MKIIGKSPFGKNRYQVVIFDLIGKPAIMIQGAGNTMVEVYDMIRKHGKEVSLCSAQVYGSHASLVENRPLKSLDCMDCTEIIHGTGKPRKHKSFIMS